MTQPQQPDFRIFKTFELAAESGRRITKPNSGVTYIPICVRPKAYLVAPKGFSAIERGYGYPIF